MQITIITAGSRGDVQPFVALGQGLKEKGHQGIQTVQADHEANA